MEGVSVLNQYEYLSSSFVRIESEAALNALMARPEVLAVYENARVDLLSAQSLPQINQPAVETAGLVGAGKTIVILDTGVDYNEAFFGCSAPGDPGCQVVELYEATLQSDPPIDDGVLDSTGHGTLVSSIAGIVAPGATLAVADVIGDVPINSQQHLDAVVEGINWAICLKSGGVLREGTPQELSCTQYDVVAMNMSFAIRPLGSPVMPFNTDPCSPAPAESALTDAIMAGIQPIAASGNKAPGTTGTFHDGVVMPACIPGVVSVGAVYDSALGDFTLDETPLCTDDTAKDVIGCWSQTASFLSLLAPGAIVDVSGVTNYSSQHAGTSFSAPFVTGAWAVMAAAMPGKSNEKILEILQQTGSDIVDTRVTEEERKTPRIDLQAALDSDSDSVFYPSDNCTDRANPTQCDGDMDGYGNTCDCDLNQSGACDTSDIPPMKTALSTNNPIGDINCSGSTDTDDIDPFKALLADPDKPGPSGYPCAGTIPCP